MRLTLTSADAKSYPIFDLSKVTVAQGGYSIDTSLLPTGLDYIKRGTLVTIASATRLAQVFKSVTVITGGSTSAPRVTKNNLFKVGDSVVVEGRLEARTISAIDTTTSTAYDIWTLSGAITGLAAGDILELGSGAGTLAWGGKVSDKAAEQMEIKVLDPDFEGATILLKANGSDALAVAYASKVLTISLANSTDVSNTIALIQTALRALGAVESVDFSTCLVMGTQSGHGAVLANPQAVATLVDSDVNLTRKPNAIVLETVKNVGTPSVSIAIAAMELEAVNFPYPVTEGQKAALGLRFHFKP